jgi:hypothetical protein
MNEQGNQHTEYNHKEGSWNTGPERNSRKEPGMILGRHHFSFEHQTVDHTNKCMGNDHDTIFV